mgnify:CR=1 FL=1
MLLVFSHFLSCVQAYDFSVSPSKLDLELVLGEEGCKKFIVGVNDNLNVLDKWGYYNSLLVEDYPYFGEKIGLEVNYDFSKFYSDNSIGICFRGKKLGEYYGVIIFTNGLANINSRVHLRVIPGKNRVTGFLVDESGEKNIWMGGIVTFGLSLIILAVLIYIRRKRLTK